MDMEKNQTNHMKTEDDLLQSILEKRLKKKIDKSKLWLDLFNKHKDFILQSLNQGVSKADLHYAFNEIVKKKYGKAYMIKPNYFYILLKRFLNSLNETLPSKELTSKEKTPISHKEEQNSPDKKTSNLGEFNEGGIL